MDYILASDAGWAMMQADCHRFMEFLVDLNNDFARDPDCDFFVFRAAADGIVRDQIDRRLAQPSVCTLRTLVFDVARHVWKAANPFLLPAAFPYAGLRPAEVRMAPFFIMESLLPDLDGRVGLSALCKYVEANLECEYELDELLNEPVVSATPVRLPLTYDNMVRHQAQFQKTIRQRQKAWYQKTVRKEMGLRSSQFAPSQASTISGPQAKRQKITATSTGDSSTATNEQSSPAQTQEQALLPPTAAPAALQELRNHVRARFVLSFDDPKTEEQDMDHVLAMNPNAVDLLKAVFDRVIGTDQEFIGEFGCLVCAATTSEETLTTSEGLAGLFSCREHVTEDDDFYIFRLRHRKAPRGTSRRI